MPVPTPDLPGGRTGWRRLLRGALPALVAVLAFAALTTLRGQPHDAPEPPPVGLPGGAHLHSFLIDPDDPDRVLLGTHFGLYASGDGGASWEVAGLGGEDVLDLAHGRDGTIVAAGRGLLATSSDGGTAWRSVDGDGLPSRNVRALASSSDGALLYAAVANEGLFVSHDGGATFRPLGGDVGARVEALAAWPGGGILAGDSARGLLLDADGDGRGWRVLVAERVRGIAATRPGFGVFATTDDGVRRLDGAGDDATHVLAIPAGGGPIARAPDDAGVIYVVGLDRHVYRSRDGGRTWSRTDQ